MSVLDHWPRQRRRFALAVVAVVLLGLPFIWLATEVRQTGDLDRWDKSIAQQVFDVRSAYPFVADVSTYLSHLGAPVLFWILVGGMCIYLRRSRKQKLLAFLLTSTIGGSLLNTAVKISVDRPRPSYKDPAAFLFQEGRSFPSGHAMSSTIAYGALVIVLLPSIPRSRKKWAFLGVCVLVLLVGLGRLGLGVHYVSDVIGGYTLGLAWLILSAAGFEIWRAERSGAPAPRGASLRHNRCTS